MQKLPIYGVIDPRITFIVACSFFLRWECLRRIGTLYSKHTFVKKACTFVVDTLLILALAPNCSWSIEASLAAQRKQAEQELKDGNFKDAYRLFKNLILKTASQNHHLDQDLRHAVDCLNNLGQVTEIDLFVERKTNDFFLELIFENLGNYLKVPTTCGTKLHYPPKSL